MDKKMIGNWGESVAQKYLKQKGYAILETNWRHRHRELDIIAYKECLVAVEVKTRKNTYLAHTVLKPQQVGRLRLALRAYCSLRCLDYQKVRLDLITVRVIGKDSVRLKHYADI